MFTLHTQLPTQGTQKPFQIEHDRSLSFFIHLRKRSTLDTMSSIKVRITYEFAEGLRTTMHCLRPAQIKHEPYTCQPRTIKVKCSLESEYSEGLRTTLELYPQEISIRLLGPFSSVLHTAQAIIK